MPTCVVSKILLDLSLLQNKDGYMRTVICGDEGSVIIADFRYRVHVLIKPQGVGAPLSNTNCIKCK